MAYLEGKYAWTVKVGEKGQFVIPKEAREIFNIKPGDTLIVLADEKQGIAIPPKDMFAQLTRSIFSQNESPVNDDKEEE
jgi:AbrB family looped-hinge helix DNA binding protein